MTYGLDAHATTLGKLLGPPHLFDVPAFQRAYSWTTEEAGQLIEDLLLALGEGDAQASTSGYFLGPILLLDGSSPNAQAGGARSFQIIDGQQRLATLTVLACVLRDLVRRDGHALPELDRMIGGGSEAGAPTRCRLQMRGSAQHTMATCIQAPGATLVEAARENLSESEALLLAVRDQFVEALADRDTATLMRLAAFLHDACSVVVITSRDVDRAHRTFAALNNRGRPLERCDIINAELMDSVTGDELARLQRDWETLGTRLGASLEMLFSHVRAAVGDVRAPVIAEIRRLATAAGGGAKFIDTVLMPFGHALADIQAAGHRGSPESAEINRRLRHLSWLPSTEWLPPLLLWWTRHHDDAHALAAFLARIDRLGFGMRVLGLGADKRQSRMQQLRTTIERGHALTLVGGPLDFSSEEMRNIRHNLRDLHRRSQLTCKLVLMRLESELAGDPGALDSEGLTVEHILPQKPARTSMWRNWFADPEEREACTGSLGNLVLVPRALNERARNQDFERKHAIFFAENAPPLPRLTAELRDVKTWNATQIRAREERLLAILDAMWHLNGAAGESGMTAERVGLRRRKKAQAAE
ncbi:MAG: DUF262 domain-containing protein [Hyphomicrobium sp.]|nr:DUF262 domain-containing protein [Hyphomicrobium sp.]